MFSGINFKEFLNTHEEWHALALGYCEVACPIPPRHSKINDEVAKILRDERWYYLFGRVLGFASLFLFAIAIRYML